MTIETLTGVRLPLTRADLSASVELASQREYAIAFARGWGFASHGRPSGRPGRLWLYRIGDQSYALLVTFSQDDARLIATAPVVGIDWIQHIAALAARSEM